MTVAQLVKSARPSLVVITSDTVRGKRRGIGTGFVVSASGLIATNLHVIGEGQAFSVATSDGRKLPVQAVHASDRALDLALIQVDVGKQPLEPLPLAAGDVPLPDGSEIVVMGNPHGLKNSVVRGVVSARRTIEGRKMLQLAIPIEPGNSGGPVLDLRGRVHGVVTMKSAITQNLGFAVEIGLLEQLQQRPNPVSFANWQTIGRLDARDWKVVFGANWRRLGGRILVQSPGSGFGGRSLCLANRKLPSPPYEVAVEVKMEDERGAAGLVFHADGRDRHYGFYPSGGKLRFTAFAGPSVYNWRILHNAAAASYRPGGWNHLKVRVDKDRFRCYVNDTLVFTTRDRSFTKGQVGLAKFRDTVAEFKSFEVAGSIARRRLDEKQLATIRAQVKQLPGLAEVKLDALGKLAKTDRDSVRLLNDEAQRLLDRATQLRQLARDVHVRSVVAQMRRLIATDPERFDLLRASLLIARLDDEAVDIEAYVKHVDRMARDLQDRFPKQPTAAQKRAALNAYLFSENGFHGARTDYDHPSKRYMNRVIDDRNGLPIMLSVLYMEIGRRCGLKLEGVGLPGHFIVRQVGVKKPQLIDVFAGGKPMDRARANELVQNATGGPLQDAHLKRATHKEIAVRMLMNLGVVANQKRDLESLLRYLELTIAVDDQLHTARLDRARVRYLTGRHQAAIEELDWLLERAPEGLDLNQIRQMRVFIERNRGD